MSAKRSNRPFAWMLFGTGGFIVAFFLPIQILIYGFAIPLGWVPNPGYDGTLALLRLPLERLYLAVLIIFCFWHAGYRIRDTIADAFSMRAVDVVLAAICYGGAIVGTIATIALLWNVP